MNTQELQKLQSYIGKDLICEFYEFKPQQNIRQIIKEAEEKYIPIILKGTLQKANIQNRNGRVYPFNILKREADKYNEMVLERSAYGQLDHPNDAIVMFNETSHLITKIWWEGETLMGEAELLETPSGNIVKAICKANGKLGISSRGVGSVKNIGGKDIVQEDFELIAFDFVTSPSTPGAYMVKEGKQWGITHITEEFINNLRNAKLSDVCSLINGNNNNILDKNILNSTPESINENLETNNEINKKYKKIYIISKNDFWN